jgi:tRNA threonylcarbamoyl adenosine modification protein (Sua5/YciO/YrdC/YwlC family)
MATVLKIHGSPPNERHVEKAVDAIRKGKIVLAPTETGYCFLGDPDRDVVYEQFFALRKAHPKTKPFSLLRDSQKMISQIAHLPTAAFRVASRLLPGPYTLVLEAHKKTPQYREGPQRKNVGVRVSNHPVAQAIAQMTSKPILVTSVTDGEELEVQHYFDEPWASDAWWTQPESILAQLPKCAEIALEWMEPVPLRVSTVLDLSGGDMIVVRNGGWGETTV